MSDGGKKGLAAYRTVLQTVSTRTGASLPSLILSFGIIHEFTAILPLVGVFYASRTFGIGERIVSSLAQDTSKTNGNVVDSAEAPSVIERPWYQAKLKTWIDEGEGWAFRVGRRYGIFGYARRQAGETAATDVILLESGVVSKRIAGDVANAVVAYAATKALLPLRIGLSLYLAPGFSRGVIEPIRLVILRAFRK